MAGSRGSLSVRKKNAAGVSPFNVPNAVRTFAQGVSYASADEIEAYLRSLASSDPNAYRRERDRIRGELERYASANPKTALGLETAGMFAGAALTPELAAVKGLQATGRFSRPVSRFVVGGLDDAAQGAAYAAGQANEVRDIPRTVAEEGPYNAAAYGGMSVAGAAGRRLMKTKPTQGALERFAAMLMRMR